MVHDGADVPVGPASLDSVRVEFTEERLVSDAGLLIAATLAERLGIEETVNGRCGLTLAVRARRCPAARS